jgi:hypothetical protein
MTLSKPVKILIGIGTFWYTIYLLFTIAGIIILIGYVFLALSMGGESLADLRTFLTQILSLKIMLPVHFCSLFLEVGLLIFYLIHTIKNTKASDALRIVLGLGHLFLPFVAMPIYYFLYIWRAHPPEWAATKPLKPGRLTETAIS